MKSAVKSLQGLAAALAVLMTGFVATGFVATGFVATGCVAPQSGAGTPAGSAGSSGGSAAIGGIDLSAFGLPEHGAQAPLYAHDGGVVAAPAAGTVRQQSAVPSALGKSPDSRLSILELYQRAVNEREELQGEVELLRTSLERAETELAATLASYKERDHAALTLQDDASRLERENAELAGRLVTAQIRRLEAERALLELKLAHQAEKEAAADAGIGLSFAPPAKKKP